MLLLLGLRADSLIFLFPRNDESVVASYCNDISGFTARTEYVRVLSPSLISAAFGWVSLLRFLLSSYSPTNITLLYLL